MAIFLFNTKTTIRTKVQFSYSLRLVCGRARELNLVSLFRTGGVPCKDIIAVIPE
jgi:hypothetical protein